MIVWQSSFGPNSTLQPPSLRRQWLDPEGHLYEMGVLEGWVDLGHRRPQRTHPTVEGVKKLAVLLSPLSSEESLLDVVQDSAALAV